MLGICYMGDSIAKKPKENSGIIQRLAKAKNLCHPRQDEPRKRHRYQIRRARITKVILILHRPSLRQRRRREIARPSILPALQSLTNISCWLNPAKSHLTWESAEISFPVTQRTAEKD